MLNCVTFVWKDQCDSADDIHSIADKAAAYLASAIGSYTHLDVSTGAFSGCAGRVIGTTPDDVAICVMSDDDLLTNGGHRISVWCQKPIPRRVGLLRRKVFPGNPTQTLLVLRALRNEIAQSPTISEALWMTEEQLLGGEPNR